MNAKKIRKLTNTIVCIGAATTILASPYFYKEKINYTEADIANNSIYIEQIKTIEDDYNINFKNEELYNKIFEITNGNITIGEIRKIKSLTLNNLFNSDLSDLKYLINLESLTIENLEFNSNQLKYNHNLKELNIINSKVNNLENLPNSLIKLQYVNSEITDGTLFVPYNTTELRIYNTFFSNLTLKNPSNLVIFTYDSFSILDLTELKDCSNLITCSITYSPNIKNASVLKDLPNLKFLTLDDYSPIWLDKSTLKSLECLDESLKEDLLSKIIFLDKTAKSLVPFEMSSIEKARSISLNVASKIEYDDSNQVEENELKSNTYNEYPITYALEGSGVCINYACLFTALANRVGLDNYQDASKDHTWNMVRINNEYKAFDVTNIDSEEAILIGENNIPTVKDNSYLYYFKLSEEEKLYYYNFDPENAYGNTHEGQILIPKETENYNIGYVKENIFEYSTENIEIQLQTLKKLMPLVPPIVLLNIILLVIEKRQSKKKVLKK